jgi:hypothetical protein
MTISLYTCLLGGFLSFIAIASKSIQQKNVQYNRYALIPPISYIQAFTELFTAGIFAKVFIAQLMFDCVILALFIGTGAWTGSMFGIKLQAWLVKVLYKEKVKV